MAGKTPVSVVVVAKNEEKVIEGCLKSVYGWADEILLIDDFSTDRTREIGQRYATKILQRATDVEGKQRNWACAQAANGWILSLDADECATPQLCVEISALLSSTPACVGYDIPRKNFVGKYWIRWGGAFPQRQAAL
jgi:glycosyltransferase involved in cell wall biosynthesis